MGFMKFKKKDKAGKLDDSLDVPPPPPMGVIGASQNIPAQDTQNLPPVPEAPQKAPTIPEPASAPTNENMQDLPLIPEPPQKEAPFPGPGIGDKTFPEKPQSDILLPEQPKADILPPEQHKADILPPEQPVEHDFDIPSITKPDVPTEKPISHEMPPKEDIHQEQAFHELVQPKPQHTIHKEVLSPAGTLKPSFIEVERYRQILKDLNNIKKSCKDVDSEINEIIGDINDEEKTFTTLHSTLASVEEKLAQLEGDFFGH